MSAVTALSKIIIQEIKNGSKVNICERCLCKIEKSDNPLAPSINTLMKLSIEYFNIPEDKLISKSHKPEYVIPRHKTMYLMLIYKHSTVKIGEAFLHKEHSGVVHARQSMRNLFETNYDQKNDFNNFYMFVKRKLENSLF